MGKETRIGIIVVGVLMGAFLGLLIKRFVLTPSYPAVEIAEPQLAGEPKPLPGADKPTVVTAQRDTEAHAADRGAANPWGTGQRGETAGDVPHGSFLPADGPPLNPRYAEPEENPRYAEPEVNPRYAETGEPTPAMQPNAEPTPAHDPFHDRFAQQRAESETPQGPAAEAAPEKIDVAPKGTEALEARQPPARPVRNPLRRLSAEEPLEAGPGGGEVVSPENLYPDLSAPGGEDTEFDPSTAAPARGGVDEFGFPDPAQPAADEANAGAEGLPARPADPFGAAPQGGDPFGAPMPEPRAAEQYAPQGDVAAPREVPPAYQPRPVGQPFGTAGTPQAMAPRPAAPPADGRYTVQPNDSLWTVSEKVYGDGRYYKAIGEHNREKLPRPDRLTVGTVLDVPATSVLEQNYPSLCPRQRRSAVVPSRTVPATAEQTIPSGGDVYVVEEGDTLFDIARYELGQASRWGEIYELNRDKLGEDFDFLQPGLELRLPARTTPGIVGQPADRYVR